MFPSPLQHGLAYLKDGARRPTAIAARLGILASALVTTAVSGIVSGGAARAQTPVSLESCTPPNSGEYLLLVVVQAAEAEDTLKQTLPPSVKAPTCNYLGTRVARMGGFRKPEDADAWASYLREVASLPAFIAQPPKPGSSTAAATAKTAATAATTSGTATTATGGSASSAQASATQPKVAVPELGSEPAIVQPVPPAQSTAPVASAATPSTTGGLPTAESVPKPDLSPRQATTRYPEATVTVPDLVGTASGSSGRVERQAANSVASATGNRFEPKSLASGYVVLVDYGNETTIANQVKSTLKRSIGLASYGQRPYLMAEYSADSSVAIATLRSLTRQGFQAILVDSQGVTLLTEQVR